MESVKEYEAKLDSKNRITIRGAKYNHYKVKELQNGKIELTPQILIEVNHISKNTLKMLDKSVENYKKGKASSPIDFPKFSSTIADE